MLPFKDQKSADVVCRQLGDLGTKINQQLQPAFTSKKIADHLRVTEENPPRINQQSVVYEFICDSCDTNYIDYTCRHLHQQIEEHKHSVIGKHLRDVHGLTPDNLSRKGLHLRNKPAPIIRNYSSTRKKVNTFNMSGMLIVLMPIMFEDLTHQNCKLDSCF